MAQSQKGPKKEVKEPKSKTRKHGFKRTSEAEHNAPFVLSQDWNRIRRFERIDVLISIRALTIICSLTRFDAWSF